MVGIGRGIAVGVFRGSLVRCGIDGVGAVYGLGGRVFRLHGSRETGAGGVEGGLHDLQEIRFGAPRAPLLAKPIDFGREMGDDFVGVIRGLAKRANFCRWRYFDGRELVAAVFAEGVVGRRSVFQRVLGGADEGCVRMGGRDDGERSREAAGGEGFAKGAGVVEGALVSGGGDLGVLFRAIIRKAGTDGIDAPLQGTGDRRGLGVTGALGAAEDGQAGEGLGGALGGGEVGGRGGVGGGIVLDDDLVDKFEDVLGGVAALQRGEHRLEYVLSGIFVVQIINGVVGSTTCPRLSIRVALRSMRGWPVARKAPASRWSRPAMGLGIDDDDDL